ncbi:MAG: RNA polymerase sigma factor [Candidatus Riflebacteria bacterium]|nr:RNA polymerase sigma factor [Candidatus Riflebacteria bacterium]
MSDKLPAVGQHKDGTVENKTISENVDDRRDVENTLRGRKESFSNLFNRYQKLVRVQVWNYFRNRNLVDDLCQEIFSRAFTSLQKLKNPGRFKSWVLQIGFRTCVDYQRSIKSSEKRQVIFDNSAEKFASFDSSPDDDSFTERDILGMIDKLSPIEGMILWMRYAEELSYEEITEILDISSDSARQKASRALRFLRDSQPKDF